MSLASDRYPDEPETHRPPPHVMPPAPDLQFVVPPTDATQPDPAAEPVHNHEAPPTASVRTIAVLTAVVVAGAIAWMLWLAS